MPTSSTIDRAAESCWSASSSTKRRDPEAMSRRRASSSSSSSRSRPTYGRSRAHSCGRRRVHEEGGLLAGAQVAGGALAGAGRIAEDSDEVVHELEGDTQPPSRLPEAAGGGVARRSQHCARLEGQGERVRAGLLLLHRKALGQRGGRQVERQPDVGKLAGGRGVQCGVQQVEQSADDLCRGAARRHRADRGGQGEVPRQDGGGDPVGLRIARRRAGGPRLGAERPADVEPAAPHVVTVDDVVVDDERGVQQLHRGADLDRGRSARAAQRVVGRDHECRPEPLAALGGGAEGLPEPGVLGIDRRGAGQSRVEQASESLVGVCGHRSSQLGLPYNG